MTKLRLFDNTRVSAWKTCPRYYYYRHIRDFVPDSAATPLIFGSAYHSAMEIIWACYRDLYTGNKTLRASVIDTAYEAFLAKWQEEGMAHPDAMSPDDLDKLHDRTPMVALEMLHNYVNAREHIFTDPTFEVVSIEEPFIVPLDPNDPTLWYVGRIDKKFRLHNRKIMGMEHKTTTEYTKNIRGGGKGYFRNNWIDRFSMSSQINGYNYALKLMHGADAGGVWIDGAALGNLPNGFKILPFDRKDDMLEAWLWEVHVWIDQIEANKAAMGATAPDAPYMAAFAKNDHACVDYMRACPYLGLCQMYPNPQRIEGVPAGYKISHWEPMDELKLGAVFEKAGVE